MKSTVSAFVLSFLALFLSLVTAAPVDLADRDVFVPPVVLPNGKSVWKIGTNQTVKWDVSHPPKQITNTKAMIILVTDGRLDIDHPLASGLNVLSGKAQVKVPKVKPGHRYQILVFGDSGNTGEVFSIVQ